MSRDLRARLALPLLPALCVASMLAPSTASAQTAARFSLRAEGGGSLFISSPQSDAFGLGLSGRVDLGARIAGPLHLRLYGGVQQWSATAQPGQTTEPAVGRAYFAGGGLSVEPWLAPRVALRGELDLGASFNGSDGDTRLTWGVGLGAWFRVASVFDLGPIVRAGAIVASDAEDIANGGRGTAYFLTFGLAISLHGAEATPPAPVEAVIEAAPPPPPPPPPPPTPVTTVVEPVAQPVAQPAPLVQLSTPVTIPATLQEESAPTTGRHGRHGRGRHGGRHGGGRRGGGHGGRHGRRH